MKIALTIIAGFMAAAVVCWLLSSERTVLDFLVVACAIMLGAFVGELLRGKDEA